MYNTGVPLLDIADLMPFGLKRKLKQERKRSCYWQLCFVPV